MSEAPFLFCANKKSPAWAGLKKGGVLALNQSGLMVIFTPSGTTGTMASTPLMMTRTALGDSVAGVAAGVGVVGSTLRMSIAAGRMTLPWR